MDLKSIITLNNTGVLLVKLGQYEGATEMFQAALRAKLLHDTFQKFGENCEVDVDAVVRSCVSVERQRVAPSLEGNPTMTKTQDIPSQTAKASQTTSSDTALKLYSKSFVLEEDIPSPAMNAVIVFNLGLSYHLQSRNSSKPSVYYKIAIALLVDVPSQGTSLFSAALLNNLAAWYHDNDERGLSSVCFRRLSDLLNQVRTDGVETPFRSNLNILSSSTL